MTYGIIGSKSTHSLLRQIHTMLGGSAFEIFERSEGKIEDLIRDPGISGFYSTDADADAIRPYCDHLTDRAVSIGSINTVVKRDGLVIGDNTDYYAFNYLLDRLGGSKMDSPTVIVGSAVSSRTVRAVLHDLGIPFTVQATGAPHMSEVSKYSDAKVLINTTSVGMSPNTEESPIDTDLFPLLSFVIDTVYNPLRTSLILRAMERGIPHSGGLPMLVAQAKAAAELFTNETIPDVRMEEIHESLRRQMGNIVLIGMPGSGKTTLGHAISKLSGKPFIDLDVEIERKVGKSIPQIFEEYGEATFRAVEKEVTFEHRNTLGSVIATGGGVILDPDNYAPLKYNGRIYYIEREVELLATGGRPLSTDFEALSRMKRKRLAKYLAFSDSTCFNFHDRIRENAAQIWEDFKAHVNC